MQTFKQYLLQIHTFHPFLACCCTCVTEKCVATRTLHQNTKCDSWRTHYKIMCINVSVPFCRILAAGICSHSTAGALVRPGVDIGWQGLAPVHPRGVGGGRGQVSVQATQLHPHQTGKMVCVWAWLCVRGLCHIETVNSVPITVATNCVKTVKKKLQAKSTRR